MEATEDESQKSVLNGLQLAYKVVANSVYGQAGSRTSAIRKIEVAACTTAAGRDRLQFAKSVIENEYDGEIVYGDTDSIFIKFKTTSLSESIDLAKKAADRITSLCRRPYKIEYEKTFYPFILFCRKRYVGMMYEDDVTKCKRKTMGIALKRRDNAPIVKDIFGTALDLLMEKRDIKFAFNHVKGMLVDVIQNKFPLEKFVITKQLRDDYITEVPDEVRRHNPGDGKSKPHQLNETKASFNLIKDYAVKHGLHLPNSSIAHRALADRMEQRDAGNKPQVGDRLSFVFVAGRKGKQGDRIEHVDYVKAKGLKVDTEFYITNQIQNPLAQLFALAIEQLNGYRPRVYREYPDLDEEQQTLKTLEQKEMDLDSMLFMTSPHILRALGKPVQQRLDNFVIRS
jgi:DNA polymerase delta subunit 1